MDEREAFCAGMLWAITHKADLDNIAAGIRASIAQHYRDAREHTAFGRGVATIRDALTEWDEQHEVRDEE